MSIYLDYNATTPCDPRVVQAMSPFWEEIYGNPSNGLHVLGRAASKAVEHAREQVAQLINALHHEIVFTAGATESNNIAILGTSEYAHPHRRRIITCAIEHKAVLLPCKKLAERGFDVVVLPVDSHGVVSLDDLRKAIDRQTFLVSIHAANNEIGTLQRVARIAEVAHEHGALFHCDAAQALGKIPVDVDRWNVDLLSMSAHKMYGPKGVGALYVRGGPRSIPIAPLMLGGGHESGLRPGTLNVPAIVGFGASSEICQTELLEEMHRLAALRDFMELALRKRIPTCQVNGHPDNRLPNTSSITIPGIEADALLLNMPELMLSTSSACNTGAIEPSHVLQAIGLTRENAHSTIRVSLGRYTFKDDIEMAVQILVSTIDRFSGVIGTEKERN